MKKLFLALAGLALALTGVGFTAPTAQAGHVTYGASATYFDDTHGRGRYGPSYTGANEGNGDRGYTFYIRNDFSTLAGVVIEYNRSWVNDGWVEGYAAGSLLPGFEAHWNKTFDPPCNDGDPGQVEIRFKINADVHSNNFVDPIDC